MSNVTKLHPTTVDETFEYLEEHRARIKSIAVVAIVDEECNVLTSRANLPDEPHPFLVVGGLEDLKTRIIMTEID